MDASGKPGTQATVDLELSPDRTGLDISIPATRLEASQLDQLIGVLGRARAEMTPPVPLSVPRSAGPNTAFEAMPDPMMTLEQDSMSGGMLIHVRDARFGWLHYVLSLEAAGELASALSQMLSAPPPNTSGRA